MCVNEKHSRDSRDFSFLFNDSGFAFGDDATSELIDALRSPYCRLTEFFIRRESNWKSRGELFSQVSCQPCTCVCVRVGEYLCTWNQARSDSQAKNGRHRHVRCSLKFHRASSFVVATFFRQLTHHLPAICPQSARQQYRDGAAI